MKIQRVEMTTWRDFEQSFHPLKYQAPLSGKLQSCSTRNQTDIQQEFPSPNLSIKQVAEVIVAPHIQELQEVLLIQLVDHLEHHHILQQELQVQLLTQQVEHQLNHLILQVHLAALLINQVEHLLVHLTQVLKVVDHHIQVLLLLVLLPMHLVHPQVHLIHQVDHPILVASLALHLIQGNQVLPFHTHKICLPTLTNKN